MNYRLKHSSRSIDILILKQMTKPISTSSIDLWVCCLLISKTNLTGQEELRYPFSLIYDTVSFYNWPIETHQAWNVIVEGKRPLSVPTTNLLVIQYDSPLSRGVLGTPRWGPGSPEGHFTNFSRKTDCVSRQLFTQLK